MLIGKISLQGALKRILNKTKIKNKIQNQFIALILMIVPCCVMIACLDIVSSQYRVIREIYNAITVFFSINLYEEEYELCKYYSRIKLYRVFQSISVVLIRSFITPFLCIIIFGNSVALIYLYIAVIHSLYKNNVLKNIVKIFDVIPGIIGSFILYLVYVYKTRSFKINFKNRFFTNAIKNPYLNINIIGAAIENVNMYYCEEKKHQISYIESYGEYKKKINIYYIEEYRELIDILCFLSFIIFYLVNYLLCKY
ncbi:hypothetical protein SAMN02745196_00376 [Clostridium collagenovorans DSM 3089]|uniref:Uncharacterized protein n=1 Tax=Clostridium collagenovorans DSM 3089 TaxID=1121306 RepID=A0A1M5SZC8_9CLOT|nr:hypothetical protein [Clostridium collagenovorans]SHH43854.1 hypothetical protein SAMN02745196_00376 [Clostridium collagenovorans DSM 3089]